MEQIFLKLLNLSITAGWLVIAVVLLRFLLKKAPKGLIVSLWALVGIRLICPFSIESVFSLIPSAQTLPPDILVSETPVIQSGIPALNAVVNPILSETLAPAAEASVKPAQSIASIASMIWLVGMASMLTYSAVSYLRLRRQVRASLLIQDSIYICDNIATPFILGVIRPSIYLPSGMTEAETRYVVAHEQAHLKRKDHLWKPFGFLLLSVYWFHPALWLAYCLLCRDIEFACDEKVIRAMDGGDKKGYSETLVSCGTGRRTFLACPLAFGEGNVKARIKSVLHYKKPAFWIILLAIVLICGAALAFLTDPVEATKVLTQEQEVYSYADSADPLPPKIILTRSDRRFQFTYSVFSSYIPIGSYELTEDTLTLRTDDGEYTYVFAVTKEGFVFDASRSSWIPAYRYSGDSDLVQSPVPDGALFRKLSASDPENPLEDSTYPTQNAEKGNSKSPSQSWGTELPFTATASWVNYYEGDELFRTALNAYTMAVSSVMHLPIWKFETATELAQFKSDYGDKYVMDYDYEGTPSFEAATAHMDDTFFVDNAVLLVYTPANSGSQRFRIYRLAYDEQSLCAHVLQVNDPEAGTADMSGWFITVTVPKQAIESVTSFDAVLFQPQSGDFDEWGLRMDIEWQSDTEFDVIFTHSSQWASATGRLAVSFEYEIRAVYNGETISVGDYVRNVLHMDYTDPVIRGNSFSIERDGIRTFHGDLTNTYGTLPVGEYVLCETVTLQTDTGEDILTKVYSAYFAVID